MEQPKKPPVTCPNCRAENAPGREVCSACGGSLTLVIESPYAPPKTSVEPAQRPTFRISSLMLVVGVVAICLGLLKEVPGLFVVLLILSVPAFGRTLAGVSRRQEKGIWMTRGEMAAMFGASLGVVSLILLASVSAFVVTCFPTGLLAMSGDSSAGLVVAVFVGVAAAGTVAFFVIRKLWPMRHPDATPRSHVPGHDPKPLPGMPGAGAGEDHHEG